MTIQCADCNEAATLAYDNRMRQATLSDAEKNERGDAYRVPKAAGIVFGIPAIAANGIQSGQGGPLTIILCPAEFERRWGAPLVIS